MAHRKLGDYELSSERRKEDDGLQEIDEDDAREELMKRTNHIWNLGRSGPSFKDSGERR